MIFFEKRFRLFRTVRVILDDAAALRVDASGSFSRITILSYRELPLKKKYRTRRKVTANINCARPPEEIINGFNKTTRNEIRKTFHTPGLIFGQATTPRERQEAYRAHTTFEYTL